MRGCGRQAEVVSPLLHRQGRRGLPHEPWAARSGEPLRPPARDALAPPVRACATWGIARLRYRPAAPALIEALERCVVLPRRSEAEAQEARNYIQVLRRLGAQEAITILIRTAREAVGLRSTAVQALVEPRPRAGRARPWSACSPTRANDSSANC